ncbi:probable G-protein coupled receptor Mth-like 7 [Drosophila eugracilis]|uniref:probable G-protein coupled receptor Mth-like 7 n=1 Tax=Drosophila eugracilis TaxID=29029 RepID=UPI001BDA60DB|nr:probable G-protein coupled receptor Mth-like 7 [Drosophila eugracilis]
MTLTSLSRNEPENRFLVYSAFAWIPAVLFTGIIFVVNKVWENDPHYWNWMPSVGFSRCVLVGSEWTSRIFINGPLIVIGIFNWTMFILTARYIRKVKKDLKYFRQRQDGTLNCLEFDGETYILFLRLSVIMGLSWMLFLCELIKWDRELWEVITKVVNYLNSSIGILYFVLLILKRSTLRMLMDRIRDQIFKLC